MQVKLNRDECISCGSCWAICPDFFEEDPDDDVVQIVQAYRVNGDISIGQVPPEQEDYVRDAAETCPVEVIQIKA